MAIDSTYSIRKRGQHCEACNKSFEDGEFIFSRVIFENGDYIRLDYCGECWPRQKFTDNLSYWKTAFLLPPPPKPEAIQKENAESLLRKLIEDEEKRHFNAVFILAVMLERKKTLVERDVQKTEDGTRIRIYEHRKTGETFFIPDPELKLDQLEHVQQEVVELMGGPEKDSTEETAATAPEAINQPVSEPDEDTTEK